MVYSNQEVVLLPIVRFIVGYLELEELQQWDFGIVHII